MTEDKRSDDDKKIAGHGTIGDNRKDGDKQNALAAQTGIRGAGESPNQPTGATGPTGSIGPAGANFGETGISAGQRNVEAGGETKPGHLGPNDKSEVGAYHVLTRNAIIDGTMYDQSKDGNYVSKDAKGDGTVQLSELYARQLQSRGVALKRVKSDKRASEGSKKELGPIPGTPPRNERRR